MFIFTDEYEAIVNRTWHNIIGSGRPFPGGDAIVRKEVWDSWQRSRAHNISPKEVKDMILSANELSIVRQRNKLLMDVSHSYIQNIYSFVRGTNFVLALTDADGFVIDLVGDDENIQSKTKKSGLRIGSNRHEHYAGTNGIGLCLQLGRPVQVWGSEHYIEPHHGYVCSAAPIKNSNGEIIGILDVVGPLGVPYSHTLAMVSASADGIEKEIKMREACNRLSVVNNQLSATVQSISNGILMIDNMGIITQYNKKACEILKLSDYNIMFKNIFDVIKHHNESTDLTGFQDDVHNMDISLTTADGSRIPVSLSASIIKNDNDEKTGTVLVMQEMKKLHMLVNKISGFTATYTFDSIIGDSQPIQVAKGIADLASQSMSNVLILGESGTGKELFAQAIHNASDRRNGPFIAINCGSLPKGLIESELFGYESGAFTGAKKEGHPGKFELANGGTIFLDEIGDMPLALQTVLLRVIQSREVIRVGGKQKKAVDVRIIAATHVNLLDSVYKNEFRDDLYYRLNVLSIDVPPLRQIRDDIETIARHFLYIQNKKLSRNIKNISTEALNCLRQYDWPGNVRELENVMERAINLCQTDLIQIQDLPPAMTNPQPKRSFGDPPYFKGHPTPETGPTYQGIEAPQAQGSTTAEGKEPTSLHEAILEALKGEHGNVTKAAQNLNIPKRTMYRKIKKYNIDLENFR